MTENIVFGGGCFWCTEAIFQRLNGVLKVVSGYAGGHTASPTYREICTGNTGHAEVIQITFDPGIIDLSTILEIFWHLHDPTTLNKQGADEGTQYRSIILYETEEQKEIAEKSKLKTEAEKVYSDPIVTEIVALEKFYPAEDYHQNYFNNNQNQGYCRIVINPKVQKLLSLYGDRLLV